ncbi:MAG: HNH endonuclease [Urechidicola sp.]|nr:HNH endonuclease [Urechidicola sp.]
MKKCLWCLNSESEVTFDKKAHTIPKSLGGENFNPNVCDKCNEYFGNKQEEKYSIEEALKEAFNITRKRILLSTKPKKQVGKFKSRFFDIKEKKGKYKVEFKTSFRFNSEFQKTLCRSFKRGLYKLYFEELNRQKQTGFESEFDLIRKFARYNENDLPVFYFQRKIGIIMLLENEAETPTLFFERMKYLYSDEYFEEIEFLGHVFGFPKKRFNLVNFDKYYKKSLEVKKGFFVGITKIEKFTNIDITFSIMNN